MIIPLGHRVLVKRLKVEERDPVFRAASKQGIVIPDAVKQPREAGVDRGEVVQIGEDAFKAYYANANPNDRDFINFRPWVQVGQFIAFAKYSGMVIEDPDNKYEYIVINDEDIVAIIEGNNE